MMGKQSVAGIVVKVTEAEIVLLCQDGTFQNVARPPRVALPLLGERYTHIEKKTSWLKYTSIAAVFLLTFISYLLLPFGQADSAYVVAIDINPSIELTVNDAMKVIETSANNPDGETLLTTIGMHGDELAVAIEKIMTYSEDAGFFMEGKYVTTSVIPVKEQKIHLTEEIEEIITNSISKPDIDVVMLQNNKATYDEAKKQNLSVNHYAYYKELESEGVVKTIEEAKGKSMAELREMQKGEKAPVEKAPGSNRPEQSKSNKPDSIDRPVHEKTNKAAPPPQSQAQENKQQAEIRKDAQEQHDPQDQVEVEVEFQIKAQNNENNHENPSRKEGPKQRELPEASENNRGAPANKDK